MTERVEHRDRRGLYEDDYAEPLYRDARPVADLIAAHGSLSAVLAWQAPDPTMAAAGAACDAGAVAHRRRWREIEDRMAVGERLSEIMADMDEHEEWGFDGP